MAKKTEQERLEELEVKLEQLKAKKQKLYTQMKEKDRKERTRRLIQIGAIFERYFGPINTEDAEIIGKVFENEVKQFLENQRKQAIELLDNA